MINPVSPRGNTRPSPRCCCHAATIRGRCKNLYRDSCCYDRENFLVVTDPELPAATSNFTQGYKPKHSWVNGQTTH